MTGRPAKVLLALIAVAIIGALGVSAMGSGRGHSGRESAQGRPRCEVGKKSRVPRHGLVSSAEGLPDPIVIGCGQSNGEAIQIVAYNVRGAFCFGVYRPERGSFEGGECKSNDARWTDYCTAVCVYSVLPVDLETGSRLRQSLVSGGASPLSENLKASFGRSGKRSDLEIVEARVSSAGLLRQLHQAEAFTAFATVVPRCVPPGDVRAEAAINGHVYTAQGQEKLRLPCRSPRLPGRRPGPA